MVKLSETVHGSGLPNCSMRKGRAEPRKWRWSTEFIGCCCIHVKTGQTYNIMAVLSCEVLPRQGDRIMEHVEIPDLVIIHA